MAVHMNDHLFYSGASRMPRNMRIAAGLINQDGGIYDPPEQSPRIDDSGGIRQPRLGLPIAPRYGDRYAATRAVFKRGNM